MATPRKSDNAQLAKDIFNLVNQNDLEHLKDHFAPNASLESVGMQQTFQGRDGVVDYVRNFKHAFPDLNLKVERQVTGEDYVISEYTASGTHRGPLQGPRGEIGPTGRSVTVPVCEVMRFNQNGELVSARQYWDSATLLGQLGVL